MKALTIFSFVILMTAMLAAGPASGDEQIPGVTRTLHRIEKNKENAGDLDKIKAKVGEGIEIDWTYPVIPESIPTEAIAKSDSAAVKHLEIDYVARHKLVGTGTLGAFFKAEKEGKALLTFVIKSKEKDGKEGGVMLKCEVEVVK